MFTEFGGGTRAPFPNSGWKSSLTEDSGWFDISTISKTRLTLTNQYIFSAESYNQYILYAAKVGQDNVNIGVVTIFRLAKTSLLQVY